MKSLMHFEIRLFFFSCQHLRPSIKCCELGNKSPGIQSDTDNTPRTWRRKKSPGFQSHTQLLGLSTQPRSEASLVKLNCIKMYLFFLLLAPWLCSLPQFSLSNSSPITNIMDQQCHKDMHIMNLSDRVILLLSPSSSLAPFLPPPHLSLSLIVSWLKLDGKLLCERLHLSFILSTLSALGTLELLMIYNRVEVGGSLV